MMRRLVELLLRVRLTTVPAVLPLIKNASPVVLTSTASLTRSRLVFVKRIPMPDEVMVALRMLTLMLSSAYMLMLPVALACVDSILTLESDRIRMPWLEEKICVWLILMLSPVEPVLFASSSIALEHERNVLPKTRVPFMRRG